MLAGFWNGNLSLSVQEQALLGVTVMEIHIHNAAQVLDLDVFVTSVEYCNYLKSPQPRLPDI